jgi:hypothetical protein
VRRGANIDNCAEQSDAKTVLVSLEWRLTTEAV